MDKNIKYHDFPETQKGVKLIIFYAIESLPEGFSVEDILELVNKRQKIPYIKGKCSPPSCELYPLIE